MHQAAPFINLGIVLLILMRCRIILLMTEYSQETLLWHTTEHTYCTRTLGCLIILLMTEYSQETLLWHTTEHTFCTRTLLNTRVGRFYTFQECQQVQSGASFSQGQNHFSTKWLNYLLADITNTSVICTVSSNARRFPSWNVAMQKLGTFLYLTSFFKQNLQKYFFIL